jgi:superfamily II DNA or RNA helicase
VSSRKLRPYQVQALHFICDNDDACLELPTGAGKTLIICTAVARQLQSGIRHVVIAAPQKQIENGFVEHGITTVTFGRQRIDLPADIVRSLGSKRRAEAVARYLQLKSPGHAVGCTHQTLAKVNADQLPASLKGSLLVIDEAHHAPSNGLGAFVSAWRQRGGRLLYATATPYRTDWQPVLLDGMKLFRRSLAQHMQEGNGRYAPHKLANEMVALDTGRPVTAAEFTGEVLPPGEVQDLLVTSMIRKWVKDGRPKTIVRLPPLAGGSSALVRKLVAGFRAAGARRVYDATGTSKKKQRDFLRFLQEERSASYAATADVVIGIQRVVEGTDWPICASVFLIGLPGSVQAVVQALGRAMRKKANDYPGPFRSKSKIVFFVLANRGETLAQLPLEHSRRALLLATFLADCEASLEWAVELELQGIVSGLADRRVSVSRNTNRAGQLQRKAEDGRLQHIPLQYRAAALHVASQIIDEAQRSGKKLEVGKLDRALRGHKLMKDIPSRDRAGVIATLLMEILLRQEGRRRVRHSIKRQAARFQLMGSMPLAKLNNAVLRAVVDEFRQKTITEKRVFESQQMQLHQLTGGDMHAFTERLTAAVHEPIKFANLHAAILDFRSRTGRWPSTVSGYCDAIGLDFRQIDHYLRHGIRGLGPDSSLYGEIKTVAAANGLLPPVRDYETASLTEADVQEALQQHYDARGATPRKGSASSPLGMSWEVLDRYLRKGGRGLGPGSSLAKQVVIFHKSKGLPVKEALRPLTYAQIHKAIRVYVSEKGQPPRRNSPGTVSLIGISWPALENLLKRGGRGLSRKSTVAKEVAKVLAQKPLPAAAKYCLADVHGAIRTYFMQNGRPPMSHSLERVPSLGVTWFTLSRWLRRESTTLLKQVKHALGNLPTPTDLTIKQVHASIFEYYRLHGALPRRGRDGKAPLIGIGWGTLNNNLRLGGRGLGPGSSLAKEAQTVAAAFGIDDHSTKPR